MTGLRPKQPGGRLKPDAVPSEAGELEQLRRKNEQLRAEVAYLGKLRVFRAQQDGEGPLRRLLKASIDWTCCCGSSGLPGQRSFITRPVWEGLTREPG
ncbi:hypothetical protein GCM10017788_59270 [Amycolatopsis acidiphila]|nr:hypothetical protein GCM10017788_59270 [Amycolatopsis acidiphila]